MGQKQSSARTATTSVIAMDTVTSLTNYSRRYLADDCARCGARLETECLVPGGKLGHVRCRVCQSENVFVEAFRPLATSSPRSIAIRQIVKMQPTYFGNDLPRSSTDTKRPLEAVCGSPRNTTSLVHQSGTSCV